MRFDTLPQIESTFNREAGPLLKRFSLDVPGESLVLNGSLYKPGRSNYFFATEHPKERIVLHFTAGNIRSDMLSLTQQDRHISVAFVIARDGTIYQLFPSKYWSGHIGAGVGNAGTGNSQDKATIGIEISNYGYLVPKDGNLETIYSRLRDPKTGKPGKEDLYCSLQDNNAFRQINTPFRGQTHYASFTDQQLESTIILLRFLTTRYNIPRSFLPEDKRFITTNDVLSFKGIVSHVNYRSSGKWDIGPAFEWDKLVAGVQAPSFTAGTGTKSLEEEKNVLHSEQEIEAEFPVSKSISEISTEATDNEGYNPNDYENFSLNGQQPKVEGMIVGLLVGINNYDKIRKLKGCIHDVETVEAWLNSLANKQNILKLTDERASRPAIIRAFRDHLSQAGSNDTILVYYSGHGTLEEAGKMWDESDRTLECLVCHDGGTTNAAEFLLTDKELRFLLHELYNKTGAHIVTIFDCCHSGDNTRNAALIEAAYSVDSEVIRRLAVNESRPSGAFPERTWEQFIFGNSIDINSVLSGQAAEFLPEGVHVQLAACESDQSAVEVNGEGVFTKALIKVLDSSGGNISYYTLANRIRQYLRFGFEQTPRIYTSSNAERLLSAGFLNRKIDPSIGFAEASFNDEKGWQLNIGAIHGVDKQTKATIADPEDPSHVYEAEIKEVFIDFTIINIPFSTDKDRVLKTTVSGLTTQKIYLELNNVNGNPSDLGFLVDNLVTRSGEHFEFQGTEGNLTRSADYTLHIRGGEAILTRSGDQYRPLVQPLSFVSEDDVEPLVEQLRHISRWHFIRQLENRDTGAVAGPLEISVNRVLNNKDKVQLEAHADAVTLEYENVNGKWTGAIEITVHNKSDQRLYVAAAYLTNAFRCFLDLVPDRVKLLAAGESFRLSINGKSTIPYSLDDFVKEYNWPVSVESIKFIVSTNLFNAEELVLGPLPPPVTLNRPKPVVVEARGFDIDNEEISFTGWTTQSLHFLYKNPVFNLADTPTLQAMLNNEDMAWFAAGLYYDLVPDENGQPTQLVIKEGIKLPEEQRGLWGDVKLWLANTIETMHRKKLYQKLKVTGKLRIVAEGDSWFQYPILVRDILDHLYRLYAVCSFSEAGDTLENYMKKREYLPALDLEKADFFLVSGGGNDILGEQFRGSLKQTPDPNDNTPKRYLNETFFNKLDKLQDWYVEMFTELLQKNPQLRILTHSYDYIIPVNTSAEPKKTSWLGKYMIEKKIEPQVEREKLIRFMVDQFNDRLKIATERFPDKITYIDVRGLVPRDSWFDEIHPTNSGFQLVADKFIAEIEKLRRS